MFNKILKNKYIYMGHPINMRIFSFVILLLVWQVTSFLIKSERSSPDDNENSSIY